MSHVKQDTLRGCAEQIAEFAADVFKDHEIIKVSEERWLCRNADRKKISYWFFVIVTPGTVIVYGDTGECMLTMYEKSIPATLGWIRSAVGSPDYLFEKMHRPPKHFYPGDAIAFIESEIRQSEKEDLELKLVGEEPEGLKVQARLREMLKETSEMAEIGELHLHTWAGICDEYSFDSEVYGLPEKWDSACFWSLHALKTFIRLFDAAMIEAPAEIGTKRAE